MGRPGLGADVFPGSHIFGPATQFAREFMMTKLTIWRRLNPPLAFLILLFILGAALAWYVEDYRFHSREKTDWLSGHAAEVRLKLAQMNGALRGLPPDPKNKHDRDLFAEARKS